MIKIPEQAESPHFPKDYEYQFLGQKQQIAKKLHKEAEFTALSLAKNAYQMYDYLESLGLITLTDFLLLLWIMQVKF